MEYKAGIVDGEGSLNIAKDRNHYVPVVRVSNNHKGIIYKFREDHGGCVCVIKKDREHPTFVWCIKGRQAHQFIRNIFPYLIVKKSQAQLLLEFYDRFKNLRWASPETKEKELGRREKIKLEIHKLNRGLMN